MNNLNTW